MAIAYYTVVKGDSLWAIAEKKLGSGLRWRELAKLNGISEKNPIIYPGQSIKYDTGTTEPPSTVPKPASKAKIEYFGLQAGTDRSVFATWSWGNSNTLNYHIMWYYSTGDGVWFIGNDSKVNYKQHVYNAPSNATRVKFYVKPISETKKVNNKETNYWTASWSTVEIYDFKDNPPTVPPVPTVKLEKYTLTANVSNLDINASHVQFQIVKDDSKVFKTGSAAIKTTSASFSCAVDSGGEYKVRARGYREKGKVYGGWSTYSSGVLTIPSPPSKITSIKAVSNTAIYIAWGASKTATKYDIEYTTEKRYFDGSSNTTVISGIDSTHYEQTGLESGKEYFFRVRAVNDIGESSWSGIKSIVIGKQPAAPTTWSSSTTVITGEVLNLYWVHNAADGSSQTFAEVEVTVDGNKNTYTIRGNNDEEEGENKTNVYGIDTSLYVEGVKIQWRVRTSGVTKVYGDWSILREVDIYAPPTLSMDVTDKDGVSLSTLVTFPFYISALAGPRTQRPTGYHVNIRSNDTYTAADNIGRERVISKGDSVYSRYFDISDPLLIEMSAFNMDLENNIEYSIVCTVSMDSGLTAEDARDFTVAWTDEQYEPTAEIGYDNDSYVTYIRPYCLDEYGELVQDITLSVYRREFDGTFTEIAVGLENSNVTYVTDPHPSLDYARYRIIAISNSTGAVSYYDPPGYPIGEKAIIIQWDEEWNSFDAVTEDALEQPPWSGSLLRLPYNIDVSDKYGLDVAHVEYIGRQHPVSYYGTQIGESASWRMAIEKDDEESLYSLRRLSRWMGDVYVREPSGSGYWASISVSFSQTHNELTIPVSMEIVRVEGGM